MCWFWKKKKYTHSKSPILKKYKKCNQCKNVFSTKFNDYLKCKKNSEFIYYCCNKCYVKCIDQGNELFLIDI